MADIRTVVVDVSTFLGFDFIQKAGGLLDEDQQLATAVIIALNTDALADEADKLPDPRDEDRRGWWGDDNAEEIWNGWPFGSKLWLLKRAKIVGKESREGATVVRVENYINEALQPFIDRRICSRVDVTATQVSDSRIDAALVIYRGPRSAIQLEYQLLWDEV